jgi:hypothetical protein
MAWLESSQPEFRERYELSTPVVAQRAMTNTRLPRIGAAVFVVVFSTGDERTQLPALDRGRMGNSDHGQRHDSSRSMIE